MQITALPRETNGFGDIYGGWLVSQMDLAGTAMASKIAGGRIATVAIDRMAFMVPVAVGAQLSFYTQTLEVGRSSIRMLVEVWSDDPLSSEWRKVTEAVFVFVAIDGSGRTRPVPPRRGLDAGTPAIAGVLVCAFLRPARGCRVPAHPRPRSTSPCCAAAAGDCGSCRRSSRPS